MNKTLLKKIGGVVANVLLYTFLALCVFAVIITAFSKKDADGAANLFGYQMRVVTSDSMAQCNLTDVSGYEIKSIPLNSMIFVELVPEDEEAADKWYSQLKVGDVLTFRYVYTNQVTITHRISYIGEKSTGGYVIELVGDNKSSETGLLTQVIDTSNTNSPNYVIGKVRTQAYFPGLLVSLLKKPVGMILIVMLPCFIIILLEVLKIVGIYNAEKRKREQEKTEKQDDELRELRRRLAELESGRSMDAPNVVPEPVAVVAPVASPVATATASEPAPIYAESAPTPTDPTYAEPAPAPMEEPIAAVPEAPESISEPIPEAPTAPASVTLDAKMAKWKADVDACMASGLSVDEWCKQNGMAKSTYYYRAKKLKEFDAAASN